MDDKRSFTLVEIMITLGIILVLALILVPNMIRNKMNANEISAITTCKTISNGLLLYALNYEEFPLSLKGITTPNVNPPYIDPNIANATSASTSYNGYWFEYALKETEDGFTLKAHPKNNMTGRRHFFVDETGVIRQGLDEGVDENSPIV